MKTKTLHAVRNYNILELAEFFQSGAFRSFVSNSTIQERKELVHYIESSIKDEDMLAMVAKLNTVQHLMRTLYAL